MEYYKINNRMKQFPFYVFISLILLSCGNNSREASYSMMAEEAVYDDVAMEAETTENTSSLPDPSEQPDMAKKKIIKDGRLNIQVTDLDKSKQRVDSLLKIYKGYYAKETQYNSNYESTYSLKIRVPVNSYEKFISDIESGNGKILFKEIDARDVTEQFVDIETRLINKRSYLDRYRELVKQAKTIKEVLDVEEHIRVLEEEIESAEGRLRHLSDQVSYSSLDLTLSKELEYKYNPGRRDSFFERLKESLSGGWNGFIDFILIIIAIWPFWILIGILIFLWMKRRKSKRDKRKNQ